MKEQERHDWKNRQEVKNIRSGILLIAVKTKSEEWLWKCEKWTSGQVKVESGKVESGKWKGIIMKVEEWLWNPLDFLVVSFC